MKQCTSTRCSKNCKFRFRYRDRTGTERDKHFNSYKEAKAFEYEVNKMKELGLQSSKIAEKMTLNQFSKSVPLSQGNERTTALANQTYDNHLRDTVGKFRIKDISREDIQKFFDENLVSYSRATQKKIKRILTTIFDYASADGHIVRNPASLVTLKGEMREREPQPLNPEQLEEFISLWDEDEVLQEHANFVVALAYTGARPQELVALEWSSVDLNERTIDINKAVKLTKNGKQYNSDVLKTKSASRILAIDDVLLARLRFRRTKYPSDKYVFSSSLGKQINLNNFRSRYWKRALLKSTLPIEVAYDLRHSFSALMWSRGVPEDKLSKMLGHSNTNVTRQWYGKWYREADFSGIKDLEKWKEQQA